MRVVPLILLCCGLVSCVSQDGPAGPLSEPVNDGSILFQAWRLSRGIGDPFARMGFYAKLVPLWSDADQPDQAMGVLDQWALEIRGLSARASYLEMEIEYARAALAGGFTERARQVLGRVVSQLPREKDFRVRGRNLAAFIQACFVDTVNTSDLLLRAVQQIYILDDPWYRVYLLTELASLYEATEGKRASNVLQQCVPPAMSIENPFTRAEAFARIARGFRTEGNKAEAADLLARVLELLGEQEVLVLARSDAESLSRTLVTLADLDRQADAAALADLLDTAVLRSPVLESLAMAYLRNGQVFAWRLTVQRLLAGLADDPERALFHAGNLVRLTGAAFPEESAWAMAASLQVLARNPQVSDPVRVSLAQDLMAGGEAGAGEAMAVLATVRSGELRAMFLMNRWAPGMKGQLELEAAIAAALTESGEGESGLRASWELRRARLAGDWSGLPAAIRALQDDAQLVGLLLDLAAAGKGKIAEGPELARVLVAIKSR